MRMDVTTAQLREHVETDLAESALSSLLAAARQEIVDRAGEVASAVQTAVEPRSAVIWLRRPASAITSVVERAAGVVTTLAPADYRLRGEHELVRLTDGPNPRAWWAGEVVVTYVPPNDLALRRRVQIDLVRLALAYTAHSSEGYGGGVTVAHREYDVERAAVLAALNPGLALA